MKNYFSDDELENIYEMLYDWLPLAMLGQFKEGSCMFNAILPTGEIQYIEVQRFTQKEILEAIEEDEEFDMDYAFKLFFDPRFDIEEESDAMYELLEIIHALKDENIEELEKKLDIIENERILAILN